MINTIKKTLLCDLSNRERREYGIQLATTLGDIEAIEGEKRSAMEGFKNRICGQQARADDLGHKIRTGKEWREVECRVLMGQPDSAHKQIQRMDTGEIVATEVMTDEDKQLRFPLLALASPYEEIEEEEADND